MNFRTSLFFPLHNCINCTFITRDRHKICRLSHFTMKKNSSKERRIDECVPEENRKRKEVSFLTEKIHDSTGCHCTAPTFRFRLRILKK